MKFLISLLMVLLLALPGMAQETVQLIGVDGLNPVSALNPYPVTSAVQSATVELAASDILTLATANGHTGVILVPLKPGKSVMVFGLRIKYTFGTTPYVNGGGSNNLNLDLKIVPFPPPGSGVTVWDSDNFGSFDFTAGNSFETLSPTITTVTAHTGIVTDFKNCSVLLSIPGGVDLTGGDGTASVTVYFSYI